MSSISSQRRELLGLCRSILRTAQTWKADNPTCTQEEREYLRQEARNIFSSFRTETDLERKRNLLAEGKTRLDLAIHYNNPYPRPMNFSQKYVMNSRSKSVQQRIHLQSKPIYLYSADV